MTADDGVMFQGKWIMDEEQKAATPEIPNRDPNEHSEQCPMTKATMIVLGLTRNGACPPIRNPKKAKKP